MMRILSAMIVALCVPACGDGGGAGTADMAPSTSLGPAPALALPCGDTAADVYTLPSGGLGPMDDAHRGDVFRCAPSESLTREHANAQAIAMGYPGPALASGFWSYRIAFRSTRASDAAAGPGAEGDMAAVLLVPENMLPGAPLVVVGHPSTGIGPTCGTARIDLADPNAKNDYSAAVIPLAGYGYPVIIPDYAGYSYGQPPGYFNAEDEAHALLDATRAAAKLLPPAMGFSKVVLVGHSQGGHAALAAHHYAPAYGLSGTLVGVATYAPYWTSLASFGAITSPLAMFNTSKDGYAIAFAAFYFYSQGELRDGPGGGLSMFQASKRDLVKQTLVGATCYDLEGLKQLGNTPYDFFDQTWVDRVGSQCAALTLGTDCSTPEAMTWLARWKKDRPALDPAGPPILVWYAGMDQNISLGFAQCARDRFAADLANAGPSGATVTYCFDPTSNHNAVPRMNAAHVNTWIAARAGIGAEPPSCASFPTGQTCQTPPNDF